MSTYSTRLKNALSTQRRILVLVLMSTVVFMSASSLVMAQEVSEGYPTDTELPLGTVVSISSADPDNIELAHINNSDYLAGVVAEESETLINFKRGSGETVQVATSGQVAVFVSDINGDITAGDFIAASWIAGVGMKARAERIVEQKLLGVALNDFNSQTPGAEEFEDIETPSGVRSAYIGKIAVKLFDREVGPDNEADRGGLELLAARIAGKDVSFVRIVAATGLFAISAIISGVFLANAIRGSFISLGRNPLASSPIFSTLLQVSGVSISLVLIGSLIAYVVLIV